MKAPLAIRALSPSDPAAPEAIDLVARRMRQTLVEVLGEARGTALYSMEWLRERVRFHLDPERAAVFVAERAGAIAGHTIVRVERDDARPAPFGLFSTTFVDPGARRRGVAAALVTRGEAWMRERGLAQAATFTAHDNRKLIALYTQRGYRLTPAGPEMVRLSRALPLG